MAYTTVITRQINGLPVPDSFAAARFDADDEVTMEWVYWPPIPNAALVEAQAMQASLRTGTGDKDLLAKLPLAIQGAGHEVTIRHSDFADESVFVAFGSIDVHVSSAMNGGLRGGTRNFGIDGREIVHPNRRAAMAGIAVDSAKL